MSCFLCFSSDGKLQTFQGNVDNVIVERITSVFPDLLIPESQDHFFICGTCLEQVLFFYTIKEASLQNCCRLKHFNDTLKGKTKCESSEIKVIIDSDKVSTHHKNPSKNHIEFIIHSNSKYLLSSKEQDETQIKEEDNEHDYHNQQLVSDKLSLNHLPDEGSSCSSNITQKHKNLRVGKVTKKDSNLTSINNAYKDQLKTQCERQKKRFKCPDCLKAFAKRRDLEKHTRVHTGDKPFKCTTCQKTFTQLSSLNIHKLTHTSEKLHECDVCHKKFSQKGNLIIHKRVHNNVRPFKCVVCNKAFVQSGNLKIHMLTHTGEKSHQCHLCEYKSAHASHLKTHIRRHTGEKPYSCKHCEKSFASTSDLKSHERRHHSNEEDSD